MRLILVAALVGSASISACKDEAPPVPTELQLQAPGPQSAEVGTTVAGLSVLVKDDRGKTMGGQPLTVVVNGGGGQISGAPAVTLSGPTPIGTWILGTTAGTNIVTVTSGNLAPITLTVLGTPGPPATLEILQGNGQTALAGTALSQAIVVRVSDRFSNAIPNTTVTFLAASGSGSLAAGTATTDGAGSATSPAWTIGKRNVPQQITVTAGQVSRTISASVATSLKIDLRFFGTGMTDSHRRVFQGAAERLSAMLIAGGNPVTATGFSVSFNCGVTGVAPLSETIDGIIIYASIQAIDGPGGTLARAGPCGFRGAAARFLPAVALMQFDVADLTTLASGGSLEDVASHEMMHTLGYGTLWRDNGLVFGSSVSSDPRYLGTAGIASCRASGGPLTCAVTIPLENTGGSGTAASHWRESTFSNELMTGYLNSGPNPFGPMSVSSMADIGYKVNPTASDTWTVSAGLIVNARVRPGMNEGWEKVHMRPVDTSDMQLEGGLLRAVKPVIR